MREPARRGGRVSKEKKSSPWNIKMEGIEFASAILSENNQT